MRKRLPWKPIIEMIPHHITNTEYHESIDQVAGVIVDCLGQLTKINHASSSEPSSPTGGKQ